ncbi:MAG: hypothetical protein R2795_08640 [Saprospiraceae bacterium]
MARIDGYQYEGYSHSAWKLGNYMVFADETHGTPLGLADISDLDDIEITDRFQSNLLQVANPTSNTSPQVYRSQPVFERQPLFPFLLPRWGRGI